jgi:hypothetical protein
VVADRMDMGNRDTFMVVLVADIKDNSMDFVSFDKQMVSSIIINSVVKYSSLTKIKSVVIT